MDNKDIADSLVRESSFTIDTKDGKKISVFLNRAADHPSSKAVILAHGMGGRPDEYIHLIARDYFNACGYDVYRIAFYWGDCPENRILHETTLQIHADDLNELVNYIKPIHQKTFICGHSYGGLTLVFANPQVTALSFWDPSYQPWERFWKESAILSDDKKYYHLRGKMLMTIGIPMVKEAEALSRDSAKNKIQKIKIPSQVIGAERTILRPDTKMLFEDLTTEKEYLEVRGAGHCFTEGKTVYDLLDKTYNWFEKFSNSKENT